MDAINNLLDKAREHCSLPSDGALAERLGVSRQLVSQWRKGHNPLADERIAQIARAAGEDAGVWLVRVRAEQTHGEAAKAWARLARQLGAAAALAIVAFIPYTASAKPLISDGQFVSNAYYVTLRVG